MTYGAGYTDLKGPDSEDDTDYNPYPGPILSLDGYYCVVGNLILVYLPDSTALSSYFPAQDFSSSLWMVLLVR